MKIVKLAIKKKIITSTTQYFDLTNLEPLACVTYQKWFGDRWALQKGECLPPPHGGCCGCLLNRTEERCLFCLDFMLAERGVGFSLAGGAAGRRWMYEMLSFGILFL